MLSDVIALLLHTRHLSPQLVCEIRWYEYEYTHISLMLNKGSWGVAGVSIICISCPVQSGKKTLVHFLKRLLLNKEGLCLFPYLLSGGVQRYWCLLHNPPLMFLSWLIFIICLHREEPSEWCSSLLFFCWWTSHLLFCSSPLSSPSPLFILSSSSVFIFLLDIILL